MTNIKDFCVGYPSVAGGVPRQFRQALAETSLAEAEWLRLPRVGCRCKLTGMSRSSILELGNRGLITIKRIRKPGATRGIVLVSKYSLLNFIESLPPIAKVT